MRAQFETAARNIVRVVGADGRTIFVPVDEGNAQWRALAASGVVIADPPAPPPAPPALLRKSRLLAALDAADAVDGRAAWAEALNRAKPATLDYWQNESRIPADNPKMQRLAAAAGLDWAALAAAAAE